MTYYNFFWNFEAFVKSVCAQTRVSETYLLRNSGLSTFGFPKCFKIRGKWLWGGSGGARGGLGPKWLQTDHFGKENYHNLGPRPRPGNEAWGGICAAWGFSGTKFAFSLWFYSVFCLLNAWRSHKIRILAACSQWFFHFRHLADTQTFAFSLRVPSVFCISDTWRAYKIRILAACSQCFLHFRHLADTQNSHSRYVFPVFFAFRTLGEHTKFAFSLRVPSFFLHFMHFAFSLRVPSGFCISGTWRTHKIRILAACSQCFLHFGHLASIQNSHSRCVFPVFFAFQALGGHTKFAFSLRVPRVFCISDTWRAHKIRILVACSRFFFLHFRHLADTQNSHSRWGSVVFLRFGRFASTPNSHPLNISIGFAILSRVLKSAGNPVWNAHSLNISIGFAILPWNVHPLNHSIGFAILSQMLVVFVCARLDSSVLFGWSNESHSLYLKFVCPPKLPIAPRMGQLLVM